MKKLNHKTEITLSELNESHLFESDSLHTSADRYRGGGEEPSIRKIKPKRLSLNDGHSLVSSPSKGCIPLGAD